MSGAGPPAANAGSNRPSRAQSARPTPPRWGAHELSASWARRIAASTDTRAGDLVLDLGAGRGALTLPLARRSRVVAVELHPGRARALRAKAPDGVTVVEGDLLRMPLPSRPFRVVANPPYAIAAALVRRVTAPGSALLSAHLVLPRWQVNRYVADPPRGFTAERGGHVPASAFRPPPRGDSTVLILRALPRHRRRARIRRR